MTDTQTPQSSKHPLAIEFNIPQYWTPEQAMAVFELLDDLREKIWHHYDIKLLELYQKEYGAPPEPTMINIDPEEQLF